MCPMSPRHGVSSCCGWRRWLTDMEGSCEHAECAGSGQGVVLRLGGWAERTHNLSLKQECCYKLLRKATYLSDFCEHGNEVRFQVHTASSMKFGIVFWDVLPCKIIVDRRFRGTCCLHHQGLSLMIEAARTSETSVGNYFTRQYIPEDNSER
jgi:hypothetical protein